MIKEVFEAVEIVSYKHEVQETKLWLVDELTVVCRDYYCEVWAKALNRAGVPAISKWRLAENVYYLVDIREASVALLHPIFALPPSD